MPPQPPPNTLYYGDNLDILRHYLDDESINLLCLDPPSSENATHTVLSPEQYGYH